MRFHIWDPASSHNITHLFTWQNSLNVYVPVSEVGTWSIAQRLKFNTETKTALSNRELTAREVTESEEVQYEKCSVLWEWVEETQPRPRMHAIFFRENAEHNAHIWRKQFTTNSVLPDYWNKSIWLYQYYLFLVTCSWGFDPHDSIHSQSNLNIFKRTLTSIPTTPSAHFNRHLMN